MWDIRDGTIIRTFSQFSEGQPLIRDLFTHAFDPTGRFYAVGGVRFFIIYDLMVRTSMILRMSSRVLLTLPPFLRTQLLGFSHLDRETAVVVAVRRFLRG